MIDLPLGENLAGCNPNKSDVIFMTASVSEQDISEEASEMSSKFSHTEGIINRMAFRTWLVPLCIKGFKYSGGVVLN